MGKIEQIKQLHIKAFYADLVKKGLAANTIKLCHSLIYPALDLAVDSDMIRKNPAKDCKKGIQKRREVEGISDFIFINSQGKPYATNAIRFLCRTFPRIY